MSIINIYVDGACRGNPGLGSWAAIIVQIGVECELCGHEPDTTNNRMELRAAIEALKALGIQQAHDDLFELSLMTSVQPQNITICTDSQYVQKGMTQWITNWKRKNWKDVKNPDLWQELDNLASKHNVTWQWVRGHSGHTMNERADRLANKAMDEFLAGKNL